MKKQTAVEWLVERLADRGILYSSDINQAKEMEQEQTEEAWNSANGGDAYYTGYEYYKQTYSK
jgi:hypothetical protein